MVRTNYFFCFVLTSIIAASSSGAEDGVFVRFRLIHPAAAKYYVKLGGYIHKSPWYLPKAAIPEGAERDVDLRLDAGQSTPWFDLGRHAGDLLHGRMHRSGGVAEFPNVTVDFICDPPAERRSIEIELATSPNVEDIVRDFKESYCGSLTSFLVSPHLQQDAEQLETASQMTRRRLQWARRASGSRRQSPKQLIVQTSFWGPQREELNLMEAEVLHLLGFNVVGNQRAEVVDAYDFRVPGHTHSVRFGPSATRDEIDELMQKHADRQQQALAAGVPFGFTDEVVCRPRIEDNEAALEHFHQWLESAKILPRDLGTADLKGVRPIETPEDFRQRAEEDEAAARRLFYYTSRFRQHAATERIGWHTQSFHRHFPPGPVTTMLVADHPYFSGTGLGMGMTPNPTWGGAPLALDWFEVGRDRPVDMIGIEDWMGLQYMYGPNTTWEGFQLMGFQAAIFRSASRGRLPTIAWITPSDETNLRLKSYSALCQGAKHFFYWTYGPTATSTENYWSDLPGAYDGVAHMTRSLSEAEHILAPGKIRKTKVALLYSISSDLWQPFGYIHMLERRATYLSLIHDQYLVDMLSEEDIATGRLDDYKVLYATDPCISSRAMEKIEAWVRGGGAVYGSCAAGSRNEFGEPVDGLAKVFGIDSVGEAVVQEGRYHVRGALNDVDYQDTIEFDSPGPIPTLGAVGVRVPISPNLSSRVVGTFHDSSPAVVVNNYGRGRAVYVAACPGLAYIKEAKFVPAELKERWPDAIRSWINTAARDSRTPRLVELSSPVVEAGIYDAPEGTALVLANFTYEQIDGLDISLDVPHRVRSIRSLQKGPLAFQHEPSSETAAGDRVRCRLDLGLTDIVLFE